MQKLLKTLTISALSLATTVAFATPKKLITHNYTNAESNAYVGGVIPSRFPTRANSINTVSWTEIIVACTGHISNGKCNALVKMNTNTPNPINLGWVYMDVRSGEVTPHDVILNGFHLHYLSPGEVEIKYAH